MKIRKRKNVDKRLKERQQNSSGSRREGYTLPGSQNPHKGRWGSRRKQLR